MVLPGLDGSFGRVSTVAMWWDPLEINLVFLEGLFQLVGAFVVENVEIRCVSVQLESSVEGGPSTGEFAGLAGLEWLCEDSIAVIVVEDHNIVVAS
jgi:hypothetical protein